MENTWGMCVDCKESYRHGIYDVCEDCIESLRVFERIHLKAKETYLYVLDFGDIFKVGIVSSHRLNNRVREIEMELAKVGKELVPSKSFVFKSSERHHLRYIEDIIKSKFQHVFLDEKILGYTEIYDGSEKETILSVIKLLNYRLNVFMNNEITLTLLSEEPQKAMEETFSHQYVYNKDMPVNNQYSLQSLI